jgi:hypothetical protein
MMWSSAVCTDEQATLMDEEASNDASHLTPYVFWL